MPEGRVADLLEAMSAIDLEGLILTKRENIRYVSGFTGSSSVAVVTAGKPILITDGRYREQADLETSGWEVVIYSSDMTKTIAGSVKDISLIGLEDSSSLGFHKRLTGALANAEITFTDGMVEGLRARKEAGEIATMREAADCARRAWQTLLPMIRPGVTERQLAAALDYRMMTAGADKPAFDTIVASGPNASKPHAGITDRALEQGDQVVIDFGARKGGYCCDLTRTVAVGEPSDRAARIAAAVLGAWDAAFAALAPGVSAPKVDAAARDYLENEGFADEFVHGLGHGVGLEVHEKPTISRLSREVLDPGMVFTIEPGVYLSGETGARHEETVLLTPAGPEIL